MEDPNFFNKKNEDYSDYGYFKLVFECQRYSLVPKKTSKEFFNSILRELIKSLKNINCYERFIELLAMKLNIDEYESNNALTVISLVIEELNDTDYLRAALMALREKEEKQKGKNLK